MNLPTKQECISYFEEYNIPINFLLHCKKVAEVGRFLAVELKKKGIEVNVELTETACLLHDLFKSVTLDELKEQAQFKAPKPTHEQIESWKKLKEKYKGKHEREIFHDLFHDKHPELAITLRDASHHKRVIEKTNERTWEEIIQHYADARVLGDQVVNLQGRFEDAFERYKDKIMKFGLERHEKEKQIIKNDEQKIFELIGVSSDILLKFNESVHEINKRAYDYFIDNYYERVKDIRDHHLYMKDLEIKQGEKVLEVGCGFGRDAKSLHEQGIDIKGTDISPKMIAKAKHLFPEIDFKVMDLRNLDFEDASFDYVIANAVLLHFPKEEIAPSLQELKRVLKKNGKIWIGVKKGSGEGFQMRKQSLRYISFFKEDEIKSIIKKEGFKIEKNYILTEKRSDGEEIEWIDVIAQKL